LHTTKLKHGVKEWVMQFLAKRFLWSEPHFKSAIQNHEYDNNFARISFAVPFKGRIMKSIINLRAQIPSKSYFLNTNYSGLKPKCFWHSINPLAEANGKGYRNIIQSP